MTSIKDFLLCLVIVLILIGTPMYFLFQREQKVVEQCQAKGGTYIGTAHGSVCAKLEIVK